MAVTGLILAGGASRRMGQDKALLQVAGQTQLQRTIRIVRHAGCEQVVVSRNSEGFVMDKVANLGPLGGLLSALPHCTHERILLLPVDMPLLSSAALEYLLQQPSPGYFAASRMPCVLPNTEQLRAYLTQQLEQQDGDRSVGGVLQHLGAHRYEWPEMHQLQNTNTPQQWQQALTFLGEQA
ncbi:putative molybdenum cofactor guanylyltransferase [Pseudidiomarina piscicola]|uniref:Putative molybdenum cofactor guanylyltransferase n=1 Tax=Pseudidiomarina piscicola TaxID=2614830 RepID=A0A6S6WQV1_9GAMM|nr:molybdenum cofactor guanylyltransferase [Pseudidiomarina piscicola]CAB0151503.1 putative molybdenum cofactor guanylyltransferase [Pseudidiomarina piscicola]VZT40982.1 putative molybdenum cofactor guanylyltransferase [Pseudomonas aeruginosa]